jgi:hypothetical protein
LNLIYCTKLTKLPNKLYVGEGFYLNNSNITKLPDNLYVGDSLNIKETSIEEIPNKLYVGWNLFIQNTPLAKKYTDEEIYEMITSTGGEIVRKIIR